MAHWLGKKYELSMPKVMQRFNKPNEALEPKAENWCCPDEYKAKKRLMSKTWHNPYTEKEEVERGKGLDQTGKPLHL